MRILIFGPNGSGKGTQSAFLIKEQKVTHVESGGIFRDHAKRGTELGKEAKKFTDQGLLVPDTITIPMVIERLTKDDCKTGFILDGFPRNPSQADALVKGLEESGTPIDLVIVIELPREIAKARLMGRCSCPNGHPNNTAIDVIKPIEKAGELFCWKCDSPVTVRKDDIDEGAIDIRLNIYFDEKEGTLGSIRVIEDWAQDKPGTKVIKVDGRGSIQEVWDSMKAQLK